MNLEKHRQYEQEANQKVEEIKQDFLNQIKELSDEEYKLKMQQFEIEAKKLKELDDEVVWL